MFKEGFVIYGLDQGVERFGTRRIGQVPPAGSIPVYIEFDDGTSTSLMNDSDVGSRLADELLCTIAWQHLCRDLNRQGQVSGADIDQLVKRPGHEAGAYAACKRFGREDLLARLKAASTQVVTAEPVGQEG